MSDPYKAGRRSVGTKMVDILPGAIPEDAAERLRFYAGRRSAQKSRSVAERLWASVGALWGRRSVR